MHDNSAITIGRVRRFVADHLRPAIVRAHADLDLTAWIVPGEPIPFAEAVRQDYVPFAPGTRWGRPWGTMWVHATGVAPAEWAVPIAAQPGRLRIEASIDPGFLPSQPGFQSEGLAFLPDGRVIKGISPRNSQLGIHVEPGQPIEFYLELASNPDVASGFDFQPTPLGDPDTAGDAPLYTFASAELGLVDTVIWALVQDIAVLEGLRSQLDPSSARAAHILGALERAIDAVDPDDIPGTAPAGRDALQAVLTVEAATSTHTLYAVGHAHIDSAWLWPVRETVRKVARTFSNALSLMDESPDFVFAASSAQQYAWIKERYPDLFERIRARVQEGRFVPVGGMWVESDTNLPAGECLVRQLTTGKRFFLEEFGVETRDVWLPDSFGYTAALPQLIDQSGSRWFLTQKPSWNQTNRIPHHTFLWEGMDGTRVFTHFPPVDKYNSDLDAADLAHAQANFADKRRASMSLLPYGYGDGGGGPTREMLAAIERLRSLDGSPRLVSASPNRFFEDAEAEYMSPPVWAGEIYLEFHRGTYTSQANTKRGNHDVEQLLHEAELWSATAAVRAGRAYPAAELEDAWRRALLLQFHDILPGTSIAWVHREAERVHAQLRVELEALIEGALEALAR